MLPYLIYLSLIFILSFHLHLCIPIGLFSSVFQAVKMLIFRVSPSVLYLPPAVLFTVVRSVTSFIAASCAGCCTSTPAPYCSDELNISPSAADRLVPRRLSFISARQVRYARFIVPAYCLPASLRHLFSEDELNRWPYGCLNTIKQRLKSQYGY